MVNQKRFWITTILAWMIFIGIDFLFYASLLRPLWQEEVAIFRSTSDLFLLIPAGYLSFFLLTLLTGYIFYKIYPQKPSRAEVVRFSVIFSLLFTFSNFLGLFSYIAIPVKQLLLFNLVYFVEIFTVIFFFFKAMFAEKYAKIVYYSIFYFFALIFMGVVIQNIF